MISCCFLLIYSDPFSEEVIKAVRDQQRDAQCSDSDEKRCNDLKGWYFGSFNEWIEI